MRESRIKKIFEILTEDFKPYTAKDLATLIDYSSKTIRDDIKQLNNLLFDNGAYIESKSGVGYKFVINDKEKFSIFIQDIWPKYAIEDEMNSQDYRINYIAVKLIRKYDYIKSDDFLDELYISKSQLNMDLKILKEKLSAYRLKIVSKPHYGMKIIGSEINIRKFLANNIDGLISKEDYKTLSNITDFSIDTIHSIESMVFKTFKKYNFVTNLVKYNNFLIYLIISLYRVSEKREIEEIDNDNIKSKNKEISKVSLEIYNEICRLYKIKFNEAELFYIDINLSTNTDSINTNDLKLEKLIDYILEKIKIAMNINLVDNVNLKSSLKAHLGPMIERGKIGIKLKNPLLEDIKKDHIALECAKISKYYIQKKYKINIDEDELGYIALHFSAAIAEKRENLNKKNVLLVCASGKATAKVLKYRFLHEFSKYINILDTSDYLKLKEINIKKYNLIVTTIPLDLYTDIPVVEVSAYLYKKDISQILRILKNKNIFDNIKCLFDRELFFNIKENCNHKDILDFLSKKVNKRTGIDSKIYYKELIDREELASTCFENKVAIPHPLNSVCNENFISVLINKNSIKWKNQKVNIVILININELIDNEIVENFYKILSEYLTNNDKILKSMQAENLEEFLKAFLN